MAVIGKRLADVLLHLVAVVVLFPALLVGLRLVFGKRGQLCPLQHSEVNSVKAVITGWCAAGFAETSHN